MADDWDTGAEEVEFQQDKFNKFDASRAPEVAAPTEIIRSEPKPDVREHVITERVELSHVPPKRDAPPSPGRKISSSPIVSSGRKTVTATTPSIAAPAPPKPMLRSEPKEGGGGAFTEKLSKEALEYFNEVSNKPFSQQAVSFLNAYWPEVGSQADFIFSVAWEKIKFADMHSKGIQYIHLYDEGNQLDFNIGLYFYEKLCKDVLDEPVGKRWREDPNYAPSMPSMMTAIVRKQELREKVDVNFDGRISFLEYLLYQYREYANPSDFVTRSLAQGTEHPEIRKARLALEEVNKAIREYEREKTRLEEQSKLPGVKGLQATASLAILNASPLAETLTKALITAEAAVRIATKKFGGASGGAVAGVSGGSGSDGALFWMNRDLEQKQSRYGKRN